MKNVRFLILTVLAILPVILFAPFDSRALAQGGPFDSRALAQGGQAPQPARPGVVAIRGGTVLTVTRGTIQNGVVVLRDGKIAAVGGPETTIPAGADVTVPAPAPALATVSDTSAFTVCVSGAEMLGAYVRLPE